MEGIRSSDRSPSWRRASPTNRNDKDAGCTKNVVAYENMMCRELGLKMHVNIIYICNIDVYDEVQTER